MYKAANPLDAKQLMLPGFLAFTQQQLYRETRTNSLTKYT
jgi:hypothetical protein